MSVDYYVRLERGRGVNVSETLLDPALADLVGELSVLDKDFRRWWADHDVLRHSFGVKRMRHPVVGDLTLDYEALTVNDDPEQVLGLHTADPDPPSGQALRLLASWSASSAGTMR